MIRALCLICRDYQANGGITDVARRTWNLAHALSAKGCAVHVIAAAEHGVSSVALDGAVVVHRVVPAIAPVLDAPDAEQALWAVRVAETYRQLDSLVGFDVVIGPDRDAETNRVEPAPSTLLVVEVHGGPHLSLSGLPDFFLDPAARAAAEMALIGIARADLVLASSAELSATVQSLTNREVVTLQPPIAISDEASVPRPTDRLELCCLGELTQSRAPELAMAVHAALQHDARDVHLTFIGRDQLTGPGGSSYRRSVLLPLIEQLDCGERSVRFIDELDAGALAERLRRSHVAIQPTFTSEFPIDAVTLCGAGLPVITRSRMDVVGDFAPDEGPLVLSGKDDSDFAAGAIRFITGELFKSNRGRAARASVLERFGAARAADRYLGAFAGARHPSSIPSALRRPTSLRPHLSIAMMADEHSDDTSRAIASILEHTDLPMSLTLIVDAGTALPAVALEDRRVTIVAAPAGTRMSARRNFAVTTLESDSDYLVLVDNHTEVESRWWERYVGAFAKDPNLGIVSESGYSLDDDSAAPLVVVDEGTCETPSDFCLFIRPLTLHRVGRFDEGIESTLGAVADFAARARRCGDGSVAVSSGRVFHHLVPGNVPRWTDVAEAVLRYNRDVSARFLVLSDIDEAVMDPSILEVFGSQFTSGDSVALTLLGRGDQADLEQYLARLTDMAAATGFDLENGPQLIVLVQDQESTADVERLALKVHCVLSSTGLPAPFGHIARIDPHSADDLRGLAARVWGSVPAMAQSA